jgi:hypothetical protein
MFEAVTRRSALLMLGAGVAAPLLAAPRVTLAEVVRRNTRARGGAAALDRMHSLAVDVEIVEKGQPIVGRYAANTSGDVRIDIYADGKNVYSEGVDRSGVWRWTGDGPAEPSKAVGAANALTNGAENHLFGWHRFPQRGHRMALMPPETIDGTPFQVVEVRYTTGQTSYFYVDPHSWQAVRRRDERAYHPDNDPTKQKVESRFYDFQRVAGVVASHRSTDVDLGTGQVLSTNRTLSRRVDPVLAADYFDRDRRAPGAWSAA